MKNNHLFLTAVLLFVSFTTYSQTLVNATGNTLTSSGYNFEYSIGEISITTIDDPSPTKTYYVTQGLLQPALKVLNPDCALINDTISYYPTPTRNFLNIVPKQDWITSYRIYAADGKLVRVGAFTLYKQINLSDLAAAVYFIKLFPGCENNYRVLKVIKQ